jgi:hypothetical protein
MAMRQNIDNMLIRQKQAIILLITLAIAILLTITIFRTK